MRFVSFHDGGSARLGVIETQSVVPVPIEQPGVASGLGAALRAGLDLIAAGRAALASDAPRLAYATLELLPPVPDPGRVLCFQDRTGGAADAPCFVPRNPASLLAARESGRRPADAGRFEAGAGLAIIIAERARNRTRVDALDCVLGYSCFSDLAVRGDWIQTPPPVPGTMLDGPAAFGPSLVSRDELPPGADELRIQCRLDGIVIHEANTSDFPCTVAEAIVQLSAAMTLEPGDVITLGLPMGAGMMRMRPAGMAPVGRVEVDIDRIGVLTNTVG